MTKTQFLNRLAARLSEVAPEEKARILQYYDEIITDRIEDGVPESEAVAAVGSVESIAGNIERDMPPAAPMNEQTSDNKKKTSPLWIVLAIVGSPIWVPLLLTLFILTFALGIVIFSLIIALFAIYISLGFSCLGFVVSGLFKFVTGDPAVGLCFIGAGLVLLSIVLFMFNPMRAAVRGMVRFAGAIFKKIKSLFIIKKGTVQ